MNKNMEDKKAYIYESHLGGLYVSDKEIPYEDLYCETCNDDDNLIFEMECFDDIEYLLSFLFKESYSLSEIFELLEQLKKCYDEEESIEYYKERLINKIIQYASDLKFYDKTFKFDVTAIFEDFKTKEIAREINKEVVVEDLSVELAMDEVRQKMVIENFDVNDYFMKIKYNNVEVLDD